MTHMKARNLAILAILILGADPAAFALTSMQSAAVPAAPTGPASSDADKKKAAAIAARNAAKARMARCRLHPETCRQSPEAGSPPRRARQDRG